MSEMPERIKAWTWNGRIDSGQWHMCGQGETTEYTRTDLHQAALAAKDAEKKAAVQAAYETCARIAEARVEFNAQDRKYLSTVGVLANIYALERSDTALSIAAAIRQAAKDT